MTHAGMFRSLLTAAAVVLPTLFPPAQAGVVASRVALQGIMGGPGTLETFNGFSIRNGDSLEISCNPLSSTATCNGQGPGLIVPGIEISQATYRVIWNGTGYFAATTSRTIRGFSAALGGQLDISFAQSQRAVGFDLAAVAFFPDVGTVSFFGPDQTTLLGTISAITLPASGAFSFAGWADAGGIGRVTLAGSAYNWSPLLDNLEFAAVSVPEPTSLALLAWRGAIGGPGPSSPRCGEIGSVT